MSLSQLLEAGVGRDQVKSWRRRGWLKRLHRGVYSFGHDSLRPEAYWWAAILACGDWVALADVSALQLHGEITFAPGPVHVTTLRRLDPQPGIAVHVTRRLKAADVTRRRGLPVTTVSRALLDLAARVAYPELRAVADELRHLDLAALRACLERNPHRPGAANVRRLLSREEAHTKSAFERRWLRVMPPLGVPWPDERNAWIAGHKVDLRHAAKQLCVELDGRAFHEQQAQMRADRRRDTDLQTAGEAVFRVVWEELDADLAPDTARAFLRLWAAR